QGSNALEKPGPGHDLRPRSRQASEGRIALEKAVQVRGAIFDSIEHLLELRQMLGLVGNPLGGANERNDRRQRVVELVADDANDALVQLGLASAECTGQLLDGDQRVRRAVDLEMALADVECLAVVVQREESIAVAEQGAAERFGRVLQQVQEV